MINQTIHVLVVEDNSDDVLFLKRALDRLGITCQISFAVNGKEAVECLSSKLGDRSADPHESALPTHVLLDLKLPMNSGLEVLEWMRTRSKLSNIPVVVFTSSQEPSDVDRAMRLGIESFRVKPAGFPEYQRVVEEIARSWKLL